MDTTERSAGFDASVNEPDYRFTLANERTFLAWMRTSLALQAVGLAVVHLLAPSDLQADPILVGLSIVLFSAVIAGTAVRQYRRNNHAIRHSQPLPTSNGAAALAIGVILCAVAIVGSHLLG